MTRDDIITLVKGNLYLKGDYNDINDTLELTLDSNDIDHLAESIAEDIINAIVPEGAVVLTKEEYDELNKEIAFGVTYDEERLKEFVNEAITNVQIQIDEIRKETVKDIYRELYLNSFQDEKMFYPTFENWTDVLKKYGVEVKE